ncbi:MAG: hypothetical protein OXO52_17220 [Rhodospirillales bacterium]|nr:hypothetical protein [Rhodospirillales bacterium]MDE0378522.1 hypothetical protein [Rhodospirillales bacterium]
MRALALKAGAEPGRAGRFGEWQHKGRRLIVVICPKPARKDALARPLDKVDRSEFPRELLASHGAKASLLPKATQRSR